MYVPIRRFLLCSTYDCAFVCLWLDLCVLVAVQRVARQLLAVLDEEVSAPVLALNTIATEGVMEQSILMLRSIGAGSAPYSDLRPYSHACISDSCRLVVHVPRESHSQTVATHTGTRPR